MESPLHTCASVVPTSLERESFTDKWVYISRATSWGADLQQLKTGGVLVMRGLAGGSLVVAQLTVSCLSVIYQLSIRALSYRSTMPMHEVPTVQNIHEPSFSFFSF